MVILSYTALLTETGFQGIVVSTKEIAMYQFKTSSVTTIPGKRQFVVSKLAANGMYQIVMETARRGKAEQCALRLRNDGNDVLLAGPGLPEHVPFTIR